MQKELLPLAEEYAKQNKRQSIWRKVVRVMACAVVFCTTYALILPAITMERPLCELEEHTHSDSCYVKLTTREVRKLTCSYETLEVHKHTEECRNEDQELICGYADFVVHEHNGSCYGAGGVQVCVLPEIKEHEHTEECYLVEEQEEHIHDDTCYRTELGELICALPETEGHAHTAECMTRGDLVCTLEETEGHAHGENCSETVLVCDLTVEPHVHTEGCYTQLVCELPEDETHTHSDECNGVVLSCDLTEQPHVHGDGCYQTNLLCDLPETAGHTHGDGCYAVVPGCGLEETEGHAHGDSCYEQLRELICQPEESEPTEAPEPELICEEEVIKLHTHDEDDCYETWVDENGEEQKRLICEETVVEEHVHTDSCFVTEEVPLENVDTLTCGQEEGETHTHTDRCYGTWELVCGKEEHTHNEECTPEPETTYYCGKEEHTHTEECTDAEGNLICELEEHFHGDGCMREDGIPVCGCDQDGATNLTDHDDSCNRKKHAVMIAENHSSEELYEMWRDLPEDVRSFVLLYIRENEKEKYQHLSELVFSDSVWAELTADELFAQWAGLTTSKKYEVLSFLKEFQPEKYNALNALRFPGVESDAMDSVAGFADIVEITPIDEIIEYLTAKQNLDGAWGAIPLDSWETPDAEQSVFDAAELSLTTILEAYDMTMYDSFGVYEEADGLKNKINDILLTVIYRYYDASDMYSGDFDAYMAENIPGAVTAYETALEYADTGIQTFAPTDLGSVVGDYTPNIEIHMFNYGSKIQDVGPLAFKATSADEELEQIANYTLQSDPIFGTLRTSTGDEDLENGYPYVTEWYSSENDVPGEGSWQYLFDKSDGYYVAGEGGNASYVDQDTNYAVKGFPVTNLRLFHYDPSKTRYTFDSRYNAVFYDYDEQSLKAYDFALRAFELGAVATGQGTYMPFNTVFDDASNVIQLTDAYGNVLDQTLPTKMPGVNSEGIAKNALCAVVPNLYALTGGEGNRTDLAFGMSMEFEFFMPKDGKINGTPMIFEFRGDDDVVVFIDGYPVLNLGGPRVVTRGTINFNTGAVTVYNQGSMTTIEPDDFVNRNTTLKEIFNLAGDTFDPYTKHSLKFYYMERWGDASNCYIDFNMPTIPDKSLTVTKDLVIDGNSEIKSFLEDTLEYKFRVVKADEEGKPTENLFVKPGMTYTILSGGVSAGTGTVGSDGTFSLKPGQSAQFTDMLVKGGGAVDYVVQEIVPENLSGQYAGVEYEVSGTTGSIETEDGTSASFVTYSTDALSAESTQTVVYRNKVNTANLSILKLTKALAPSASFDSDKTFDIRVELGGELLPVGTQYQVEVNGEKTEIRTVNTAGIVALKINETATILDEILSGTEFEVTELGAETGGFTPSYSGTLTHKDKTSTDIACTANGASGEFALNSVAHVTVTNANYDFAGQIPIYKQALDNSSTATFQFLVQEVEKDTWTVKDNLPGTSITVSDAAEHGGTVTIGYEANTNATFYYKISEQRGTGPYVYDDTFYIVEVNVSNQGANGQGTATVTGIWKNGTEKAGKVLFINRRTTSLMVTKQVTGNVSGSGTFGFEATVTLNGQPFNLPQPTSGKYTVSENKAIFELGNGGAISIEGIPYNAEVVVSEVRHDGYTAYYRVDDIHTEDQLGETVTVNFTSGTQTVRFLNVGGYELPETGGAGTYLYTMGGLLLIMAAAVLLYIQTTKRRKEETLSSF